MTDYFPFILFLLFVLYGFSFIFIIVFIRKNDGISLDLVGFLRIFLGDWKNYYHVNRLFVKSAIESGLNTFITNFVSYANLISPLAIVILVIIWAVLTI